MALSVCRPWVSLIALFVAGALPSSLIGQTPEFHLEGEVVSRYFWRGLSSSSSVNLQPYASVTTGAVEAGVWGSVGVDGYQEVNLSLAYSREFRQGNFKVGVNDYFVAGDGISFGDFLDYGGIEAGEPTGAHTVELVVEYFGPERFPIRALLARNTYGDPDGSWYGEFGATMSAGAMEIAPVLGMTLSTSPYYYGPTDATIVQLGLTVSRELFSLWDRNLLASGAGFHNPDQGKTYWVFALGL